MSFGKNVGFILLAVYLILTGIGHLLTGFAIPVIAMSVLAIVAGVFLLIGK